MHKAIILVYPRIAFEDNYPCSWIPYSILSIASALDKKNGIDVIIFDQNRKDENEFCSIVNKYRDILLCVGFSIMTGGGQIKNALQLASIVSMINPEIQIVFGGPHVNVMPEETLRNNLVDVVLAGLGQESLPRFITALQENKGFENIPGLIMKTAGGLLYGSDNNLENKQLTPYHFDLINVECYVQKDNTIAERTINYISTQGCAYSCRFCYETNYKKNIIKCL
jgi:radical SAM superfamily enzyme YgiQ (UPF0313 family)